MTAILNPTALTSESVVPRPARTSRRWCATGASTRLPTLLQGRTYVLVGYVAPEADLRMRRLLDACDSAPLASLFNVSSHPDVQTLDRQAEAWQRLALPPDTVIVAIGGGSVIDTAKVLAAHLAQPRQLKTMELLKAASSGDIPAWPVIALPTTAGSGSEVMPWATLWDHRQRQKFVLSARSLRPEVALVDPLLCLNAPRELVLAAGLDVLSHALESLWNRKADANSRTLAVSAARGVLHTLPALLQRPDSVDLWTAQCEASLTAGLALARTQTALAHELAYRLTLEHGVPHGVAGSFCLPQVMRLASGHDENCDHALAAVFGPDLDAGAAALEAFLQRLGVGTRCTDHGVSELQWAQWIEQALRGPLGRNFIASASMRVV